MHVCMMRLTDEQEGYIENSSSLVCETIMVCMKTLAFLDHVQRQSLAVAPRGCGGAVELKSQHSWARLEKETADAGPRIRE